MRAADAAAAAAVGQLQDQDTAGIHPLTGAAWRDDVLRQRRFEAENPDTVIRNAQDPSARTGQRWDGTLGGVYSFWARSLGGLLDLMEPAAAKRRPFLLAALRERWQHTYRIWYSAEACEYQAEPKRTKRLLAAPSAPGIETTIREDAAAHAAADQTGQDEHQLKTRHGDLYEDIRFDGRWHARRRNGTPREFSTDTAGGLDDILAADAAP